MSEEKPYEATPSRLQAARKKGDVTRSQEIGNVLSFAAAILGCTAIVPFVGAAFQTAIRSAVREGTNVSALGGIALAMCIPAACAACGAYLAGVIQAGGLAMAPVNVDLARLAPGANLARMWSRQAAIAAARGTVAFAVAATLAVPVLYDAYSALLRNTGITGVAAVAWKGSLRSAFLACAVGAVFAACDYGVQFVSRRARLRMTFDEMRRDHKEHEGDPRTRGRRTALHRSIVRGSLQQLPNASFIITNPTHIAVALRYAPPDIAVPVILFAAADELALRVREQAAAYDIPIVENVPLARALFASASTGRVIAPEMYIGVAEVIASLANVAGRTW